MDKFVYNNGKDASIGHKSFKLNCGFHIRVFYEENINFYLKSKAIDKLAAMLKAVISVYKKNFYLTQKLQK